MIDYASTFPDPNVVIPEFEPHFPALVETVEAGIEHGRAVFACAAERGRHLSRSWKSHTLTECIVSVGKERLIGDSPIKARDSDLFQLGDNLFLFKKSKSDRRALAQNHQSDRQDRLRDGQGLLDFPQARVVFVVFKMDATYTQLVDVSLACPMGYEENKWAHPFLDAIRNQIVLIPIPEKQPAKLTVPDRIVIRKKGNDGDGSA